MANLQGYNLAKQQVNLLMIFRLKFSKKQLKTSTLTIEIF